MLWGRLLVWGNSMFYREDQLIARITGFVMLMYTYYTSLLVVGSRFKIAKYE